MCCRHAQLKGIHRVVVGPQKIVHGLVFASSDELTKIRQLLKAHRLQLPCAPCRRPWGAENLEGLPDSPGTKTIERVDSESAPNLRMSARCFNTGYRCHKATGNHQATRWRRARRLTYPIGQRALLSPSPRLAWLPSTNESMGTPRKLSIFSDISPGAGHSTRICSSWPRSTFGF
jgi:hypothetical protein